MEQLIAFIHNPENTAFLIYAFGALTGFCVSVILSFVEKLCDFFRIYCGKK